MRTLTFNIFSPFLQLIRSSKFITLTTFLIIGTINNSFAQQHFNDKHIMHLAKEYMRVENYTEAQTLFEQLSKQHPENNNFKYYLGVCSFKLGNTEKALSYFRESAKDSAGSNIDF